MRNVWMVCVLVLLGGCMKHAPPADLFSGTNYPDASIQCEVEDPVQGGLSSSEFAALQAFLGAAICSHGSQPIRSVREGVDAELFAPAAQPRVRQLMHEAARRETASPWRASAWGMEASLCASASKHHTSRMKAMLK